MSFQPLAVARYGVWLAVAAAAMSAWLGVRAGASLDYAVLRSVFVFVVFSALGFGAEAVLTLGVQPSARPEAPRADAPVDQDEQAA